MQVDARRLDVVAIAGFDADAAREQLLLDAPVGQDHASSAPVAR
jgi:hypothetical protein